LLVEAATASGGSLTTTELFALGFSRGEVDAMVRNRVLIRRRRGVYVVGHLEQSERGRWREVLRCAGPHAFLDRVTAAQFWKVTKRASRVVDVTVPTVRRPIPGARMRRSTRAGADEIVVVDGLRVASVARMVMSLASVVGAPELVAVMREAGHRGVLDVDAIVELVDQERGMPGTPIVQEALRLRMCRSAGKRSHAEQRIREYFLQFPVEVSEWNVPVSAFGEAFEVDLVFRSSRIYVEVDGATHDAENVQVEDERQDALLGAAGWRPFRIDPREFDRDPVLACADALAALLAAAASLRNSS
jgi:very-short-patch-repair endonuclease